MKLGKKYFTGDVPGSFVALFSGKTITGISGTLLGLFLPIFIYNLLGDNISQLMLYYGLISLVYAITIIPGAKFLSRFGWRRALMWSVVTGAAYFSIFYFITPENRLPLIILAGAILIIHRTFFWLPFHINFAKCSDDKNRAKEVGVLYAARDIIGVLIPLVSGFIIVRFGFDILFLIAIVVYLLAAVPFYFVPRTREKFTWSFGQTWKNVFKKRSEVL